MKKKGWFLLVLLVLVGSVGSVGSVGIAKRCGNLSLVEKTITPTPKPVSSQAKLSEDIFIRIFFLRLPDGKEREILEKDPRAMTREAWHALNEASRAGLSGKFILKFHKNSVEEPAEYMVEVEVKNGVGIVSLTRDFLKEFKAYSIWPEEKLMLMYRFHWPPSGWQKGEVSEFLRARIHHRVFITY